MNRRAVAVFAAVGLWMCFAAAAQASPKSRVPPLSPAWVFDHWVWEDDVNNEKAVLDLVDGYAKLGIPVGGVIIDSPWSVEYDDYVFNKSAYPDPKGLIGKLHRRGIRVVLWTTAMLNETSDGGGPYEPRTNAIFREARDKGYLANGGKSYKWWKGEGGFIDYTNPDALKWWHGLMDRALDVGADGWKVDGVDPMFPPKGFGWSGEITKDQYKDMYYMDMYDYTVSRKPWAAVMVRSVDGLAVNPRGFAPISHTNVSWVGDNTHTWDTNGFLEALRNIFDAAKLGYAVVGSDIAGYNGDQEITKNLLLRWTQFGALCPFMENGGHGAHQPWLHDDETVRIYRKYVKLHQELKPYFYSTMTQSHLKGGSMMRPKSGRWQYTLGDSLFVSVIYEDKNSREVEFPEGTWIDFWDAKTYRGGEKVEYAAPLDRYPLFVRAGSILPLEVRDGEVGHGTKASAGKLTIDVYPGGHAKLDIYEEGRPKVQAAMRDGAAELKIELRGGARACVLRALLNKAPRAVTLNGKPLAARKSLDTAIKTPGGFYFDAATRRLYAALPMGKVVTVAIKK